MRVKSQEIEVILTNDEAWELAFAIKQSIKSNIDHYISLNHDSYGRGLEGHAKPLFEDQNRRKLDMMNMLVAVTDGRDKFLEEDLWRDLEREYIKKHGSANPKNIETT